MATVFKPSAMPAISALRAAGSRQLRTVPRQFARNQARRTYYSSSNTTFSAGRTSKFLVGVAGAGIVASGVASYLTYQNQSLRLDAPPTKNLNTKPDIGPKSTPPEFKDYKAVYDAIATRLEEHDDYEDGSYGPVLLRLAWHCSGTYDADTGTGGSNGATMRFDLEGEHAANNGLKIAREFLEPLKKQFPWISYSDLWTLAGVCAVQEMQGPIVPWRPGRADRDDSWCAPDGRLPDGTKEQNHLRRIFGRMGFSDQEIVALSGAHALGRCHVDRSGFEGPWTFSPTVVTNDYYRLLVDEKWHWRSWEGKSQYQDDGSKSLMMLPTDMALVDDSDFLPVVKKYAEDNDVFFNDFADVLCKLFELGVPFESSEESRFRFPPKAVE